MSSKEDNITAWFAAQSRAKEKLFPIGIGDDMAQVRLSADASVLITTDMLVEGVHFELDKISVEQAGYKATAVSLSDCAAMATVPLCVVVSVALPAAADEQYLKQLHAGIVRSANMFDCELIGGDITAWRKGDANQKLVINSTVLSRPCNSEPVRRSGAKAGDVICVTGALGGSIKGRHAAFVPKVNEAIAIAERVRLNSMMDISDGLSSDLNRICKASGVAAVLNAEQIPVSDDVPDGNIIDRLAAALNDGEDFELLFTLSETEYSKLMKEFPHGQTSCSSCEIIRIGVVVDGDGIEMVIPEGNVQKVLPSGYDHL